jgi:probable membrane protein
LHGIIVGLGAFMLIGIFHPIVIKTEYYFSKKAFPFFIVAGIVFLAMSVFIKNHILSSLLGIAGFSSFWSILELFEQEKRVEKGWFPVNPKRKNQGAKRYKPDKDCTDTKV